MLEGTQGELNAAAGSLIRTTKLWTGKRLVSNEHVKNPYAPAFYLQSVQATNGSWSHVETLKKGKDKTKNIYIK